MEPSAPPAVPIRRDREMDMRFWLEQAEAELQALS
jgi:hypothetical protein